MVKVAQKYGIAFTEKEIGLFDAQKEMHGLDIRRVKKLFSNMLRS
jgi:hypothetical protein